MTKKKQNGRRPKKIKMEDDQKNSKWKTTKKIQNGRRSKKFKMEDDKKIKMEDDKKNSKWKTTKKIKMEDDKKNQYVRLKLHSFDFRLQKGKRAKNKNFNKCLKLSNSCF